MTSPVAPSGHQYEIAAAGYRAVIVEVGGGVRQLEHEGRPLLDDYREDEVCVGAKGQLLVPWPNRVDRGRYRFDGEDRQLDLSEPETGCAIHGLARWESWQVASHEADRVALVHRLHPHPGYPAVLDLEVEHVLDVDGLRVRTTARNVGGTRAPYGLGAHPYLHADGDLDDCTLSIPGATRLPTDDRGIPTGRESVEGTPYDFRSPRVIGDLDIDYAFTDLARDEDGRAWTRLVSPDGANAALWVDESFGYVEIFTGDTLPPEHRRRGIGVEPMTMPPNALATGEDVIALEPGESHTSTWGISSRDDT